MKLAAEYDGAVIPWDWAAFNTGFLSNSLATLIGVIVGIPIGVRLSRVQEERQGQAEQLRTAQDHLVAVSALRDELKHNAKLLNQLSQGSELDKVHYYRLDTDLWPAAMPTLIRAIQDTDLLSEISRTYHKLDEISRKIEAHMRLRMDPMTINLEGAMAAEAGSLAQSITTDCLLHHKPISDLVERLGAEVGQLRSRTVSAARAADPETASGLTRFQR